MNKKNYDCFDEKQILDRGKCFQYAFFSGLITNTVLFFVYELLNIKFNAYFGYIAALWIPLTVCFISLIVKNAYDGVGTKTGRIAFAVFSAAGLFIEVSVLFHIISADVNSLANDDIYTYAAHILCGACMIIVAVVYFIKQWKNSKEFED